MAFKPHYGNCSNQDCGRTGVLIPVRSGLCDKCNYERKQKAKSGRGNPSPSCGDDNRCQELDTSDNGRICSQGFEAAYSGDSSTILLYEEEEKGNVFSSRKRKSKITGYKKSFKGYKKNASGEKDVFTEIAEEREWVCFVTGQYLKELTATQFLHVLSKALNKYPLFKLYKPNIQLATNEVHYLWDHTPRSELRKDKRFDKLFELEEQLKEEYKLLKSKL